MRSTIDHHSRFAMSGLQPGFADASAPPSTVTIVSLVAGLLVLAGLLALVW